MPKVTQDQLRELIAQDEIAGLTLDTTEFHHLGYNFDSKLLLALGQFAQTQIDVVFSEVVLSEVHAHKRDDIAEKFAKARGSIRQVAKAVGHDLNPIELLEKNNIPQDASAHATKLLERYLGEVQADRILAGPEVTGALLSELYFNAKAPFSTKADKKSEFPDAIALLSLEQWARDKQKYVLAVSDDGDWSRFAEEADFVICVRGLSSTLNLFNLNNGVIAAKLAAKLAAGEAAQLMSLIERELEGHIEYFDVEASAPYYYEVTDEYATLNGWRATPDQFDVLASDEETVTLAFTVSVSAAFHASFAFQVKDGIDKDYIPIGGTEAKQDEEFDVQIIATVGRGDEADELEIVELESEGSSLFIDFGNVEVDYGDEYYE